MSLKEMKSNVLDFSKHIAERTEYFAGREWIFRQIDDWLADPQGSRYFIIDSNAGSGKTAIAARLAQFSQGLEAPHGMKAIKEGFLGAIHFCSTRENMWLDSKTFSKSLAAQLAKDPAFAESLLDNNSEKPITINNVMEGNSAREVVGVIIENLNTGTKSDYEVFLNMVRKPLEETSKKTVILVDALDEAPPLAEMLAYNDTLSNNVRFILTTRILDRIESKFKGAAFLHLSSDQHSKENHDDILGYIKNRIKNDPGLSEHSIDDKYAATLAEKSSISHFLYTRFVLDAVSQKKLEPDIESLEKLPPGLDDLFAEFLARMEEHGKHDWGMCTDILGVMCVAKEGMSAEQLASFVSDYKKPVLDILDDLKPFTIKEDGRFRLYHQSIVDFFGTPEHRFFLPPIDYHKKIVSRYLENNQGILDWSKKDDYGLRYLPSHMWDVCQKDNESELLYELARDQTFAEEQKKRFPDNPQIALDTVDYALQQAVMSDDPVPIAEFLLSYASRVHYIKSESPLQVLEKNKDDLTKALRISDLYDPPVSEVWHLFLAWKMEQDGRRQDAIDVLERLTKKDLVAIPNPERYNIEFFMSFVYRTYPEFFLALCNRLLENKSFEGIASMLSSIAVSQSATDKESAAKTFEMATKAAEGIDDSYYKARALSSIAASQSATDKESAAKTFEMATKVAEKIDDYYYKTEALSLIASALAEKGNFEMATKAEEGIDDSYYKARALSLIAASQSATDKESAAKTFEMATKAEEGIDDDPYYEAEALSLIASALAEKGNFEMATKVAEGMYDSHYKADALSSITASQSATDKESAAKTFEMATKVAEGIDHPYYKARALSSIAASQSATDKESAAKTFEMATKVAKKIDDSDYKAEALSSIAASQSATDKESAAKTFEMATKVAEGIDDYYHKADALSLIASAFAKKGNFGMATKVAEKIDRSDSKARALSSIVSALAEKGNFGMATKVAKKIDRSDSKARALSSIVSALAEKGNFGMATKVAKKIDRSDSKA
ncbi:MAG: hypothetical protein OEW49_04985, partial [Nitrosopumilus sp.]|nr:hypothetical protein [Nitrosopumilus sp.]